MCKDAGIRLPDNSKLLSLKGGTSIVYHADEPGMVEVYTIEAAKANYWHYVEFGTYPIEVGEVTIHGWHYDYGSHKQRKWHFPVFQSFVPFVQVSSYRNPIKVEGEVDSDRIRKYVHGLYDKHLNSRKWSGKDDGQWLCNLWNDLYDPDGPSPECVKLAADFALNGVDVTSTTPQTPPDAFALWEGKIFWLDPYHEDCVLDAVRSRANYPARGW
jgi:hypothetical protein